MPAALLLIKLPYQKNQVQNYHTGNTCSCKKDESEFKLKVHHLISPNGLLVKTSKTKTDLIYSISPIFM
jgi:hypothetical protein